MAKFNRTPSLSARFAARTDATVNHEGALAFEMDPRSRLYTRVCASLTGEDKFYTGADASAAELFTDVRAAADVDPEFVLRLAAFGRQEMNIRSTPLAVLVEAASIPACKPFVRKWTPEIVRRADELAETLACWIAFHGNIGSHGSAGGASAFPNALTRGLEDALENFGEYEFAKYDRAGAVTLRDVLRVVRPKPKSDTRSALYRFLVKGSLDNRELLPLLAAKADLVRKTEFDAEARKLAAASQATWEVLTSKFGAKPEVWNAATLPFMAGLRNIANLMRSGADEALDRVMAMLVDPNHVRRSRQLPYRFYSAYAALGGTRPGTRSCWSGSESPDPVDERVTSHPWYAAVLDAVQQALALSVANLPRLPGRTFIASDNSGSMEDALSAKSAVRRCDVANLLAAIAHTMCDEAICSVFGESHAVVPVVKSDSVLTNMARLKDTDVGWSTNAWLGVRHLREKRIPVDRIILLSDMQCYSTHGPESLAEEFVKYRSSVNPAAYLYSVDLAGYGTAQFPASDRRVALLSGWSERLLAFIPLFEADGADAVSRIAAWEPRARVRPQAA